MREKKLKELEESHEAGAISKEEYDKKKKEIEEAPEEEKPKEEDKEPEEEKKIPFRSDIILIVVVAIVLIGLGIFIGIAYLSANEEPQTIDDLHELNLKGKLDPEIGYLYKGIHSFVKQDEVWYTKLESPTGKTEFSFNFRYSPRDLEDISIVGTLDKDKFNDATEYFVTFNPLGQDFSHIRLARFDYDTQMIKVFQKTPKSACDRDASNQTSACEGIPVITCKNTDDIVVYFVEAEDMSVEYQDNCIIIQGQGFDFVKGVDRVLYNLYGVMDQ